VKKVLVIDDSETVREQVRQTLSGAGYEIVEAIDGVDGLEKLRETKDVALALCDVNMPRMTGLEMVAELHRTGISIPIVMLTSEGQPSLIRRARDAGAKGWIVKPFKPELLLEAMNKLLPSNDTSPR
jgi:two-component system chemotaxis response regulator CheY